MVALMCVRNPIRALLPALLPETILTAVGFREGSGSVNAARRRAHQVAAVWRDIDPEVTS